MKKVFALLLTVALCAPFCLSAAAAETRVQTLNVVCFNVDGLPIPSFLSSTKRPAAKATRLIAEQVNNAGCDILCVQEDFNFHGILRKGLDMPCATRTSGPAVVGDGLNIFSKYPVYNVERHPWEAAYGVFDCGSDELTPKGVLCCTVDLGGAFVDVYTLHADAWEDDDSMQAKADQFDQLLRLVETYSGSRAVLLTGDFNTNYTTFREGYKGGHYKIDLCRKLLDNFVENGFRDAWVEANADGRYDFTSAEMIARYGVPYPRTWDTLDHIYYRSGEGVTLDLVDACYDGFDCDAIDWQGHLSDHAAVRASFNVTIDPDACTPPDKLEKEPFRPLTDVVRAAKSILGTVLLALRHLPDLLEKGIGWLK